MEPSRDIPWAEHEKVYLLAEIMKAAPVSSERLFHIIKSAGIQPKWAEIALPQGRSLRQSQMAFQDLIAQFSAHDSRGGGTASAGPVQYHLAHQPSPQQHQQQHPHAVFHGHQPPVEIPRKRPLAPDVSTQTGRLLQPRPPNPYPAADPAAAAAASAAAASSMLHQHQHHHQGAVAGPAYIMSPTLGTEGTSKKRRGRPTKAEAQARAAEAAARGEPYPPPKTGKRASMVSALSSSSGGAEAPGAGRSAGAGTRSPGTPVSGAVGGAGTMIRPEREQMSVSSMMTAPAGERGLGESGSAAAREGRVRERQSSLDVPVSPKANPEVSESAGGVLASPTKAGAQVPEGRRDTLLTQGSPVAVSTTSSPGEERERETPREASEEHKRRATPHSFKDTVGI
ncbi:hypothetical protein SLS58_005549 [Diplodia intermedia]|uniref:Uncharacterized protein n=1 Tax=Diplodia intermedia TaxID=856260 RepID=A0ABR3TQG3_9PEZI